MRDCCSAAGTGERPLLERLLELGAPVQAPDAAGWTPLHWAAAAGHASCAASLLEAGASPALPDAQGRLPLHWAAERGWAEAVAALVPAMVAAGVDLHSPVRPAQLDRCICCNVVAKDPQGLDDEGLEFCELQFAVQHEPFNAHASAQADTGCVLGVPQDKAGASPAALAAAGGHVECVACCLDSSSTANERDLSALHLAVQVPAGPNVSLFTYPKALLLYRHFVAGFLDMHDDDHRHAACAM